MNHLPPNMSGGSRHRLKSGVDVQVPLCKGTWHGLRKMDQWLLDVMRLEAKARQDEVTPTFFLYERPGHFPPSTRDDLNDYIFTESTPLASEQPSPCVGLPQEHH
jgi:hypothetical protein